MITKRQNIITLILFSALSILPFASRSQTSEVTEAFGQTYPLSPDGRVGLENINGNVRVTVWDRNEVRVDAVKRAYSQERLAEAKIEIDASPNAIHIKTQYPQRNNDWSDAEERRRNNPASVEYTLTVPRGARIDKIALINGSLDIENAAGEVVASSINGRVSARHLTGEVNLSTINGRLEATFERLSEPQRISLNSVNGPVVLIAPSYTSTELRASTVHGGIENTLGLQVEKGRHVGRSLSAVLGDGNAKIKLGNVNGSITIRN